MASELLESSPDTPDGDHIDDWEWEEGITQWDDALFMIIDDRERCPEGDAVEFPSE